MTHATLLKFAPLALLIAEAADGQKVTVTVTATSNIFAS